MLKTTDIQNPVTQWNRNAEISQTVESDALYCDLVNEELAELIKEFADLMFVQAGLNYVRASDDGKLSKIKQAFIQTLAVFDLEHKAEDFFNEVVISNNSKFVIASELRAARKKFESDGIEVTEKPLDNLLTAFFSQHDQTVNGKKYPVGKLLKPATYKPAKINLTEVNL